MDVNSVIKKIVGEKNIPTNSLRVRDWLSWWRGDVFGFHNYRYYNGNDYITMKRKTLQIAKHISETFANLLFNERCDIIIPDADKVILNDILYENNFWINANEYLEKGFALGKAAILLNIEKLYVSQVTAAINKTDSRVTLDFVDATKIIPITIERKRVTECAFVSECSDKTNVVIHMRDSNGIYKIHNYSFDKNGKEIGKAFMFDTKSNKQWFWIIRPNIASNIMTESMDDEIGVSVFANSIDTLKAIDTKYDGFDSEFLLGRKKMYVSAEAWKISKVDGATTRTFDPNDDLYYALPENSDGKQIIQSVSDTLRYDAYIKAINAELSYLGMKCGLGEGYYKFDGNSIQTATQVISENSTLFRTIKKHEILLEQVLKEMTMAITSASNEFTNKKFSDIKMTDIVIKFDDSIIEDKNAEMVRDKADVLAGLMSKVEYRMKWYGEDENTAIEKIKRYFEYEHIGNYTPALTAGVMTPEQFVEKVYPDVGNKEELIAYISDYMSVPEVSDMNDFYRGEETETEIELGEETPDTEDDTEEVGEEDGEEDND